MGRRAALAVLSVGVEWWVCIGWGDALAVTVEYRLDAIELMPSHM